MTQRQVTLDPKYENFKGTLLLLISYAKSTCLGVKWPLSVTNVPRLYIRIIIKA